jgi:hypothetical protein
MIIVMMMIKIIMIKSMSMSMSMIMISITIIMIMMMIESGRPAVELMADGTPNSYSLLEFDPPDEQRSVPLPLPQVSNTNTNTNKILNHTLALLSIPTRC